VELLDKNVGVREHELWTRLAVMRNKKVTGFVGWVTYELAKVPCHLQNRRCMEKSQVEGIES
jgi:CRISPR/Cas system endoribonuclease Cas6 (RAMP superfamily)